MPQKSNPNLIRISAHIDEDIARYLNELSLQAKISGGKKPAIAQIIRALLNVLKKTDLDVTGIKSEGELERRIFEGFKE